MDKSQNYILFVLLIVVHFVGFIITVFLYVFKQLKSSSNKKALVLLAWTISDVFQRDSTISLI